jgi:four helix bundle protein
MNKNNVYDLEALTKQFSIRVIRICRALPKDAVNDRLIRQAVGSSNSVGANYLEANDALSKKDMINRFCISRKEAKEIKFHLECIAEANPLFKSRMYNIIQEADELKRILSSIIDKLIKT